MGDYHKNNLEPSQDRKERMLVVYANDDDVGGVLQAACLYAVYTLQSCRETTGECRRRIFYIWIRGCKSSIGSSKCNNISTILSLPRLLKRVTVSPFVSRGRETSCVSHRHEFS